MRLRLVVGNICQNPVMPLEWVREDALKARKADPDIVLLNEIGTPGYKSVIDNVFSYLTGYHEAFLKHTENPILLDKEVGRLSATRSIELVDGERKITPDRDLNVAKIRLFHFNKDIVVMDTHWPNAAFSWKRPFSRKRRRQLWRKCRIRTEEEIAYWVERGLIVIIAGDFNRKDMPHLHARFKWVAGPGIVKVGVAVPRDSYLKIKLVDEHIISAVHTDKPLRVVDFELRKA